MNDNNLLIANLQGKLREVVALQKRTQGICEDIDNDILKLRDKKLGGHKLFVGAEKMPYNCIHPEVILNYSFVKSGIEIMTSATTKPLIDKLPSTVFNFHKKKHGFERYPEAPRYLHLDTTDSEHALCILHKEKMRSDGRTVYVVDLWCYVKSLTVGSLADVSDLVVDLKSDAGVNFHTASSDEYKGEHVRYVWENKHLADNINRLSIDSNHYKILSSLVDMYCVVTGNSPHGFLQLKAIEINDDDKLYSPITSNRANALCGAVYNAMMSVSDRPKNYFYRH